MKIFLLILFFPFITFSQTIVENPDISAEFPEGNQKLITFLSENINYPEEAKKQQVQGKVYVSFIVEIDGSVSNVKVLRGVNAYLDREAVRVVSSFPNFNPATKDGKPVRTKMVLPILFKL